MKYLKAAAFWLLLGTCFYGVGYSSWKVYNAMNNICQGKCAHGDKHCQQMCLDRGFCPRERE